MVASVDELLKSWSAAFAGSNMTEFTNNNMTELFRQT